MTTDLQWVALCDLESLPGDGMYPFEVDERRIVVFLVEGKLYATDNVCSHAFALLTDGWLDETIIECPLHGAQFDIETGAVVRGPADCAIATFPVRERDGMVEVGVGG